MNIHVLFTDETQAVLAAVFGCPQSADECPHQGQIADSDPRHLAYIAASGQGVPSAASVIASERYKREGAGISVIGLAIETTRDSQALIASTGLSAILDPAYRCNFKTATGFVEVGSVQIIAIAKAVRAHVQACFDRELALLLAIEAGEYSAEMLAEGWPDSPPLPEPVELQ